MDPKRNREIAPKNLTDIVFEHRNKEYGGFQIRSTYLRSLRLSFFIVFAFIAIGTLVVYFWKIDPIFEQAENGGNSVFKSVEYTHDRIPPPNQTPFLNINETPTVKTEAKPEIAVKQTPKTNIRVRAINKENKEIKLSIDTTQKKLLANLLQRHKNNVQKEKPNPEDTIILILEKLPQFPGGLPGIQSYFARRQHYPMNALLKGIQGSVLVSFMVNKKGVVEMAKVTEGVDPELDWEAIRLINTMPAWQPGYYKGKPIACMMMMPVDFKIR